MLTYLFWPRPPVVPYDNPKVIALLVLTIGLIAASIALSVWRKRLSNSVTKKLSRSWSSAAFWFGFIGLLLVIARVEDVSYVSMRFWWIPWTVSFVLYLFIQVKLFRTKHYSVVPTEKTTDPRKEYLPRGKG